MEARPFSRQDFSAFVDLVTTNAANRAIGHTYLMNSDIAWQFPGSDPKENLKLWWRDSDLIAYAWFQPPDGLKFDVRYDLIEYDEVLMEAMKWVEARRSEFDGSFPFYLNLISMSEWAESLQNLDHISASDDRLIVTSVLETDIYRFKLLKRLGFEPTDHFEPILRRSLTDLEQSSSDRFTVRHVEEDELEKRVNLHVKAWAPSSGFTLDRYLKIRAMSELYDPELDIVAVAQDGDFASYTIAWIDPISKTGSFEPFGTSPDYRGTGVSQLVINEGFRRMKEKGMTEVRLYTAGFNHQAQSLYRSCGFKQIDTNRTMIKKLT